MEREIDYQNKLCETLRNAITNYKKSPKDRLKIPYIETRLEVVDNLWQDFKEGHKNLVLNLSEKEEKECKYFKDNTYDNFEETYIHYKSKLKEDIQTLIDASKQPAPSSGGSMSCIESEQKTVSHIKLPCIEIPKFGGRYDDWQTFYDLFCSLIHNNKTLTPVQKLHYLKGNLTGDPELLIRNFTTTDANYDEAWNQLVKRYSNKRLNCNAILRNLFTQRCITTESASSIKHLVDTTSTCLKALKNLGVATDAWDMIINHLVLTKLDSESIKRWEQQLSVDETELPTWAQLREFLEARFRSLEMIDSHKIKPYQSKPVVTSAVKPKAFHSSLNKDERSEYKEVKNENRDVRKLEMKCALCTKNHFVYHCQKFTDMTPKQRQEFVQKNKLCFNCLAPSHPVIRCRQSACCRKCGRRHHSLLHFERERSSEAPETADGGTTSKGTVGDCASGESNDVHIVTNFSQENTYNCVLLPTVEVLLNSKNGCNYIIRALLDQGSQASFVSEATVQLLNLKRKAVSGWVSGVCDGQTKIKHMVSLNIRSRHNPETVVNVDAYVLRSVTSLLPPFKLSSPQWPEMDIVELADPGYKTPGRIDILLGAEVYSNVMLDGVIKHPNGNLLAQKTSLGWVLSGRTARESSNYTNIKSMHIQVKEDDLLKLFWEIENEPNTLKKRLTSEEKLCERYYDTTTQRDEDGRYTVKLPFKNEEPECRNGNLREIATKRFEMLEKRLSRNEKLRDEYSKVMEEYIQLEHMMQVPDAEVNNPDAVYLPHHAVLREDKDTTKLRVVFDASCKGTNDISLNDELMVGAKLQQDLRHILMRWRIYKVCLSADVIKMYRMVRVAHEDTDYQRVLWRSSPSKPIQHYKHMRLTFGTSCAPYLAVKSLQRLADDEKARFPIAATITKQDFYVDDLLTCCETEASGINIYNEMNSLMSSGGFELQKWSSNSQNVLDYIGDNKREGHEVPLRVNSLIKVLGVCWNRNTDRFEYTVNLPEVKQPITKRLILSEVAKLYDPLGWIAPIVVVTKLIIQKLWMTGLDWDSVITGELLDEWLQIRENLIHIKSISIPRWLQYSSKAKAELHAFSDASCSAFAAAVYIRVIEDNEVHVHLLSAKTKVAPVTKQLSIPRLELCGAALAAKLIYETAEVLNIPKENLYAWTDSTIVLAWLKGGSSRWTTFVSNRVSEILNILDYDQWGHVRTEMNPADCASRGILASEISKHTLWWHGPAWLSTLIKELSPIHIEDTHEEEKVRALTALFATTEDIIWAKFSNLNKLLRVVSYCKRWSNLRLSKEKRQIYNKFISTKELKDALNICIKQVQHLEFSEELNQLKSLGHVLKKSKLRSLCPIFDENGILRVGGRLQQSKVSFDTQHPIILPAKSYLSRLIIMDAHHKTMHGGPQIMLNYLRAKYWILRARDQTKKYYRECVKCIRYSKKKTPQFMGQLPEVRVTPDRAFKSTGIDYAGPINIRFSPGRGSKSYKGYICLFVCMVVQFIWRL